MPVAMKRRAFIEILGIGHIKITNSYNSKEFHLSPGKSTGIDLVSLKEADSKSLFYCRCKIINTTTFVNVYNAQNNPPCFGTLDTFGGKHSDNFRCTVIED